MVKARSEQEADRVRPGDTAQAEQRKRQQGRLGPRFDDEEQREQGRPGGKQGDSLGSRPANLGCLGDGVDEHQQGGRDRHGAAGVVASRSVVGAALWHHLGHEGECRRADGDVEEEDVLPSGVGREDSACQQADGPAQGAHPAPDAEGLVALGSLGVQVHHGRQGRGEHERRPEPLDPAHHHEEGVRRGRQGARSRRRSARRRSLPTASRTRGNGARGRWRAGPRSRS